MVTDISATFVEVTSYDAEAVGHIEDRCDLVAGCLGYAKEAPLLLEARLQSQQLLRYQAAADGVTLIG